MKKTIIALAIIAALPGVADAKKRTHVTVHKEAPAQQPAGVAVAAIPVIGMFYDLARRTDCRGDVLGAGGPGFDSNPVGNYMTPAIYRSKCAVAPKAY
jgi:hypothetical protein